MDEPERRPGHALAEWLADEVRSLASVAPDGECAWRPDNVPDVLQAAVKVGLAPAGAQPRVELNGRNGKPKWLSVSAPARDPGEDWRTFTRRAEDAVLAQCETKLTPKSLREGATGFSWVRDELLGHGRDPLESVWVVLWFETESGDTELVRDEKVVAELERQAALAAAPKVRTPNRVIVWVTSPFLLVLCSCFPLLLPHASGYLWATFGGGQLSAWGLVMVVYLMLSPFLHAALVVLMWLPGSRVGGGLRAVLSLWNAWPPALGLFLFLRG